MWCAVTTDTFASAHVQYHTSYGGHMYAVYSGQVVMHGSLSSKTEVNDA